MASSNNPFEDGNSESPLSPNIGTEFSRNDSIEQEDIESEDPTRASELLAMYYGVKAESKIQNNEDSRIRPGIVGASAQKWDLDSAAFDAQSYTKSLVTESPLEELLQKDEEMVTQIKALDGDMQMLVYENYNKFIAATDTIRKMKQNVEAMEVEMAALKENLGSIDTYSGHINAALADKRQEVDKLVRVRRLLRRLEFLFELPQRLAKSVEMGSYGQAIQYYKMTDNILEKHSQVSSFAAIREESHLIIKDLTVKIRAALGKEDIALNTVSEYCQFLLTLEGDRSELQSLFLMHQKHHLEKTIDANRVLMQQEELDLKQGMKKAYENFATVFSNGISEYRTLFLNTDQDTQEALEEFLSMIKAILNNFFPMLRERVQGALVFKEGVGVNEEEIFLGIHTLLGTLQSLLEDLEVLHRQLPEAGLQDRAHEFVEVVMRDQVRTAFGWLRCTAVEHLTELVRQVRLSEEKGSQGEEPDEDLNYPELVSKTLQAVIKDTETVVASLQPLQELQMDSEAGGTGILSVILQSDVWLFVYWLTKILKDLAEIIDIGDDDFDDIIVDEDDGLAAGRQALNAEPHLYHIDSSQLFEARDKGQGGGQAMGQEPRLALVLACFCNQLSDSAVPHFRQILHRKTPSSPGREDKDAFGHLESESDRYAANSASMLLLQYTEVVGAKLSKIVRVSFQTPNWMKVKEPREVRMAVSILLEELDLVADEVSAILDDPRPNPAPRGEMAYRRRGRGGGVAAKGLQLDIERLFANADVHHTSSFGAGALRFEGEAVVSACFRQALKTAIECSRLCRFSRPGYQQVQIDCEMLHEMLPFYVSNCSSLDSMLEEIMISVAERCIEPTHLDASIVAGIILKAQGKKT